MNKTKTNMIILITGVVAILVGSIFLFILQERDKPEVKESSPASDVEINDLTSDEINENLSLYRSTISEEEDELTASTDPVLVNNMNFFDGKDFSLYNCLSLPSYLDDYFSYYLGEYMQLHVTIDEESYEKTESYKTFTFHVEEFNQYKFRCSVYPGDEDYLYIKCKQFESDHPVSD